MSYAFHTNSCVCAYYYFDQFIDSQVPAQMNERLYDNTIIRSRVTFRLHVQYTISQNYIIIHYGREVLRRELIQLHAESHRQTNFY